VRRAAGSLAGSVDVVDVHFALYALVPLYTTGLRRLPLVVHFQGPWADESRLARGQGRFTVAVKRAVERAVYRRAVTVVVLSEAFGRLVAERYGVDPKRVVVVPPGVDLDRFSPGDRLAARQRLSLPTEAFVVVSARRLEARMGLDVLLAAWGKVQAVHHDVVLLVAGEGRERQHLEALRAQLPHPDGVRLLGRVSDDELVELYRAADCSVVPTRVLEGFGLVTLESVACGAPAIVTDVGGLPDGVVDLDPSLVLPAADVDALADRLVAAADGVLPHRDACRRHAETFAWDAVARRHLEIYDRARGHRPLRVAYVGHTAVLSGGELALARLLPALDGVEPVVVLGEDGPLVERLQRAGTTVEVLLMDEGARGLRRDRVGVGRLPVPALLASLRYSWRLQRRLRALRVDLVHTNTLKAALYGGLAGRLAGVPVVWHIRDRIATDYLPRPAVALVRALARVLPSAVIANSEATLATIEPSRHASVVPSPVVYDAVAPGALNGDAVEANAASRIARPFTVGLVGRLAPWKGQAMFLRAFAASFPDGEERAVIVGSAMFGEEAWAEGLPVLAGSLGIAERVEFVGFVDDVVAEYARMDVLVHASTIPEPFGQVVVEGMAASLPVVAADTGGPGEVVTDGVDGLLYPMGDAGALAGRLRQLAADPGLRRRLGQAGRRRAEDFRPERAADQVMRVYDAVLGR
jgi:glycosyltransferase involved in cell wall biosynthesis